MILKIHSSKLASSSIRNLKREASNIKVKFNPYTMRRLKERDITKTEVLKVIKKGALIEYHTLKKDRRILLRDEDGLCIVLDLDRRLIITAYKNDADDTHKFMNTDAYLFGV